MTEFQLTLDFIPHSLKNSQAIRRSRKTGKPFVSKSDRARRDLERIRNEAWLAARVTHARTLFEDANVEVDIVVQENPPRTHITVCRTGPRPKGRADRKRDIHNVPDCVMDALQGVIFDDDRQARRVTARYGVVELEEETNP